MARKGSISGTLIKRDNTWFLNLDSRTITISTPFIMDQALVNQSVSLAGSNE